MNFEILTKKYLLMEKFVEIQNWGLNALTISFLMTIFFTFFQAYGFIKQGQKIWKKRSAKSLSPPFFFLLFFWFIAFIIYGFNKNSLAMIINGLLFIPCISVVAGIINFKRLTIFEFLSFIMAASVIPIMIVVKNKEIFVFVVMMISLAVLLGQLVVMVRAKSRGSVEIKFAIVFLTTAVFWFIYSYSIGDWALEVFNSVSIIIYSLIIYFYYRYK